ncbi:MAG TPA: hypothetical protein IAA30_09810 [Candidatus Treponema faecavium]|nr:hypothetical protein [Candidatus Treponema faecavium]
MMEYQTQTAAVHPVLPVHIISQWQNLHLPFIRHEFCRWPAAHLPIANFQFADGKVKVCNRQVSRWPTAKFLPDKRQIFILPSANFLFASGKYVSLLCR